MTGVDTLVYNMIPIPALVQYAGAGAVAESAFCSTGNDYGHMAMSAAAGVGGAFAASMIQSTFQIPSLF
jgi:hypothetical protein